jgi:TPR repeat protein
MRGATTKRPSHLRWFGQSKGDAEARTSLAQCTAMVASVTWDLGSAVGWFRKAASQVTRRLRTTSAPCTAMVAASPERGRGRAMVPQAAEQGDALAWYNLGVMYV